GRLPLDHEIAPALQLAELVEAPVHQQAVPAPEHRLPARQGLAAAEAHEGENDETGGGADAALGDRLAGEDGIGRDPHQESLLLQLVASPQAALAAVSAALLRRDPRQEEAPE